MPPADDFAVGRGGLDTPGARLEHGFEHRPTAVGHQRQQRFVNCGEGDFGTGSRLAAARHLHLGLHRLSHLVLRLIAADLDLQLVLVQPDLQLHHAELVRRLGQVDHRRWRLVLAPLVAEGAPPLERPAPTPVEEGLPGHVAHAATQHQHAGKHVRRPGAGAVFVSTLVRSLTEGFRNEHFNHRVIALQRHDAAGDHALALDADQRGGLAVRHSHLQPGGVAGHQAGAVGQHVDAVVVVLLEPELALPRDPHCGRGLGSAAGLVAAAGHQLDLSSGVQRRLAQQHAARVGLAFADDTQIFSAGLLVIGIEAADQPFARRLPLRGPRLHGHLGTGDGLAVQAQHQRLELDLAAGRRVAAAAQADDALGWPQRHVGGSGLHLAIRVVEAHLHLQLGRPRELGQTAQFQCCCAIGIGAGSLFVDHQAGGVVAGTFILFVGSSALAGLAWRGEREILITRKLNGSIAQQGAGANG